MLINWKPRLMDEENGGEGGGGGAEPTAAELAAEVKRLTELNSTLSSEAASRRKTASELKDQLKAFEGIDPEAVRKQIEDSMTAEQRQAQKDNEHKAVVQQLNDKIETLEKRYDNEVVDKTLTSVFASLDAIDTAECVQLVRPQIGRDDDGVFVKDANGMPMLQDGKRIGLEDFAKSWVEKRPHHLKAGHEGSGSEGSGSAADGVKTVKRSVFDGWNDSQRSEFSIAGGKVVD